MVKISETNALYFPSHNLTLNLAPFWLKSQLQVIKSAITLVRTFY